MALTDKQLEEYVNGVDLDSSVQEPKRGEAIFEGTDYPRSWDGMIGQTHAKEQLQVQIASSLHRNARLEHCLLASGTHGIGKTTLATLLAYRAGVGIIQTGESLDAVKARRLMRTMRDRDILFIDEVHTLVAGGRNKADWLLPFMTEGRFYTDRGAEDMPAVTIVAATTDVGKLPQTLISRFMVQPALVPYTEEEGALIAANLAGRMKVAGLSVEDHTAIALAADNNPRSMRRILTAVRDLQYAFPDTHPNLAKAFEYAGLSDDGLSIVAREFLLVLLTNDDLASIESIKAQLGEPGPLKHEEQVLLQRGLVTVTGRGRKLTDSGRRRAILELTRLREKAR